MYYISLVNFVKSISRFLSLSWAIITCFKMVARQVTYKNQKTKPNVGRVSAIAAAAVNNDKSNVKLKSKANALSQQPTLTGFLREPQSAGLSKPVRSSSLQDLRDCSLENEVDLEAPVDAVGTTWAEDEVNSTDLNPVNMEASRTVGLEEMILSEGQTSLTTSGKTWAELLVANRAKFTSNGPLMHKSATATVTESITSHSDKPGHSETVQHKAEVPPIFVAYRKVSADGEYISLMQVATAVLQVMGD